MATHPTDFGILTNFDGPDTGPPATPGWANVGHWGDPVGFVTLSNQMASSGGGWRADEWATAYSRTLAVGFGMDIAVTGAGDCYYFLFESSSLMTGYTLRFSGTNTWTLGFFDGSYNSLAEAFTQTPANGDAFCIIADNDTYVRAWYRTGGVWTMRSEAVDTQFTGNLFPGISAANTNIRWDNMIGGNPTSLPPVSMWDALDIYDSGVGTDGGPPPTGGLWLEKNFNIYP